MKCGFVSLVGRPNVGKSTLLNSILGMKLAITSNVSGTTRNVIQGIYNDKDSQIVFVDTPGIHKPTHKLGNLMNKKAYNNTEGVDVILFLIEADSTEIGRGDRIILDKIKDSGAKVIGIGKIEDIFSKAGITHAIHTGSNKEGLELTLKALRKELPLSEIEYKDSNITDETKELIFTNLVDTDMLYGHRNDAKGYGKAIEEIDRYLKEILPLINENDLLIITADHGCDPTVEGTDHTREYVPVIYYSKNIESKNLGLTLGFDSIAKRVDNWLF